MTLNNDSVLRADIFHTIKGNSSCLNDPSMLVGFLDKIWTPKSIDKVSDGVSTLILEVDGVPSPEDMTRLSLDLQSFEDNIFPLIDDTDDIYYSSSLVLALPTAVDSVNSCVKAYCENTLFNRASNVFDSDNMDDFKKVIDDIRTIIKQLNSTSKDYKWDDILIFNEIPLLKRYISDPSYDEIIDIAINFTDYDDMQASLFRSVLINNAKKKKKSISK